MPSATDLVTEVQISDPEHETLYLPSNIALDKHAEYGLSCLAVEELLLCEGEAYDALDSVRHAVKYAMCLRADKHKHAKGQMMNLRAGDLVRDAENKQAKCVCQAGDDWPRAICRIFTGNVPRNETAGFMDEGRFRQTQSG